MTRRTGRDQKTKDPAVLGIDLGSTALRAALVDFATQTLQPVQNLDVAQDSLFSKGDFPASCCPFSKNPLENVGEKAIELPRNVSAKYLMYLLANADDLVLEQYPLSHELRQRRGDAAFLATCRQILVQLLKNLRKRVDHVCEKKLLEYTEIVLTIPIQWEKPFQTVYVSIVAEAFGWEGKEDSISVALEADALAHYIINEEQRELEDWQYVLFLDFGGHSMSFSQFKLDQLGEITTFIEMSSGGCAGGSEMWSHYVSVIIADRLGRQGINDVDERRRWSLTKQFSNKKPSIIEDLRAGKVRTLLLYYGEPNGTPTVVVLSPADIKECFNRAMSAPIELAREKLKELAENDEASVGVVVSGGSLKTSQARENVFAGGFVDMKRVKFTSEMDFQYLSLVNCHGAALARTNNTTVQDFFKDGAALGIQVLHNALTNDLWSDDVYLLLDGKGAYQQQVFSKKKKGMQLKIVCDPHYGHRAARPDAPGLDGRSVKTLDINHCYDLFHLGSLGAGTTTIDAKMESEEGATVLNIIMSLNWGVRCRTTRTNRLLPIYFDPAHNSLHVDLDIMGEQVYNEQQRFIRGYEEPASAPVSLNPEDNDDPQPEPKGQSPAKPYQLRTKTEKKKPHRLEESTEPSSSRRKTRRLNSKSTIRARITNAPAPKAKKPARGRSVRKAGAAPPTRAGPATTSHAVSDSAPVDVDDVNSAADDFHDLKPGSQDSKLQQPSTSRADLRSQDTKGKAASRISTPMVGADPMIASYSPNSDGIVSPTPKPVTASTNLRHNHGRSLLRLGDAFAAGLTLTPARR
ncbi:hypothetical protein B0T19DRAFT_458502 [Cercophora scortea]|uniref:Uncharacterized protein n=1 Tax=Cercophora scortea TaxID=314031 RepID=A0AAE0IY02_9PEZI|nr:hypothetical protein B0T19DRAFT_458502 [Cercophora scortea]